MEIGRRKSAKLVFASSLVNQFVTLCQGILFVPIYISCFGVEKYGYWLATGGVIAWLGIFDLRLASAMGQRMSALFATHQYREAARAFGGGLKILAVVSALPFVVLLLGDKQIVHFVAGHTVYKDELRFAFQIAVFGIFIKFFGQAFGEFSRSFQWSSMLLWGSVAAGPAMVAAILLSLHLKLGLSTIPIGVLAHTLTMMIFQLVSLVYICRKRSINLSWFWESCSETRSFYRKVMPSLFTSRIGSGVVLKIEPLIIAKFISAEMATIFSITRAATLILGGVINGFSGSLFSGFSHIFGEGNVSLASRRLREFLSAIFYVSYILLGSYLLLNEQFIGLWVGLEMYGGFGLTLLIAFATGCHTCSNFIFSIITAAGAIQFSSWLRLYSELAKLLLMLFLVPVFGVNGAPLAIIFVGPVVFFVARWKLLSYGIEDFLRLNVRSLIALAGGFIVCWALVYGDHLNFSESSILGGIIYGIVIAGILLATSFGVSNLFRSVIFTELSRCHPRLNRALSAHL